MILVSNSYWIGEEIPCLTFGLRGVVHATLSVRLLPRAPLADALQIASDQPDLHSGMQGGVVSEPLGDMVRLLSSLTDGEGKVLVPRFLDEVRVLGEAEGKLFDEVVRRCAGYLPSELCVTRLTESRDKSDKLRKHSHISDPRRSLIARYVSLFLLYYADHRAKLASTRPFDPQRVRRRTIQDAHPLRRKRLHLPPHRARPVPRGDHRATQVVSHQILLHPPHL